MSEPNNEQQQAKGIKKPHLSRAFIVGIGTTGLRVITEIRRQLNLRWGNPDLLPSIDYLVLETNTRELEREQALPGEYRGDVDLPPGKKMSVAISNTAFYREKIRTEQYLNWLAPEAVQGDLTLGAGGVRMKGRLALFHKYEAIKEAIRAGIHRVSYAEPDDRFELGHKTWVYLVGTLGGGTCSGCFIDLAYICRKALEEEQVGNKTLLGMFTLPPASQVTHNQAVNAYAALQELNHWNYLGTAFQAQYTQNPVHRIRYTEEPFNYCFLLGPTNGCQVSLSETDQNKKLADFIFLASATDSLDKVHGDLVDQEIYQIRPDNTGCPCHYLSFGLNTIEFPLLAVRNVLSAYMVYNVLDRWTRAEEANRMGISDAAREVFEAVGIGTLGVTQEMQMVRTLKGEEELNDVTRIWRERSRPRIDASVNEMLAQGQLTGIAPYLEEEFNKSIAPLNRGFDPQRDPLELDEHQLGEILRAMQSTARLLVQNTVYRIEQELAARYTGMGGARMGGLVLATTVLEECMALANRLSEEATQQATNYRGTNQNFDYERQEKQRQIHSCTSFLTKLAGNPRLQIETAFGHWRDATEGYIYYTVEYFAFSFAAAVYRRLEYQLGLARDRALTLIGDVRRQAELMSQRIAGTSISPESLWSVAELDASYEKYRDTTAESEVTAAALARIFKGTHYESTPFPLLLMEVDHRYLGEMMLEEASRKFDRLKQERALDRWWQIHTDRGDIKPAMANFLRGSQPYLIFPQQSIDDMWWQQQQCRRIYSMHGADEDKASQQERFFKQALMDVNPPGYEQGPPREREFQEVTEPYLVTAAVTLAGFPLRVVELVRQLRQHFNQGKTGTENAVPLWSRADVAFRPIEVPGTAEQRRAWWLLALGYMLGFVDRQSDVNGVRFRYAYRDLNGQNQTLLSEKLPTVNPPSDPIEAAEALASQTAEKDRLVAKLYEVNQLDIPPPLRPLVVSLCSSTDGLNSLERTINEHVNRDKLAARRELVEHCNEAEERRLYWWPYLRQLFVKWQQDVLRMPPAENVGQLQPRGSADLELEVGETHLFQVRAFTKDGLGAEIREWEAGFLTWRSEDPNVAVAGVRGCQAVRPGNTRIIGEFSNDERILSVVYNITVHPAVAAIRIEGPSDLDLMQGSPQTDRVPIRLLAEDGQVPPSIAPLAPHRVQWRSTRDAVAVVEGGHIVGKAAGEEAEIVGEYRRISGDLLTVRYRVRVWPSVDDLVALPEALLRVPLGKVVTLEAGGRYRGQEAAINQGKVKWSMPPSPVGELQGARFIALQPGQVVIKGELAVGNGFPLLTTYTVQVVPVGETALNGGTPPPASLPEPAPTPPLPAPTVTEALTDVGAPPPLPPVAGLPAAGMSRQQVIEMLGTPNSQQKERKADGLWEYYFYDRPDYTVVTVTLVKGKVTAVEIE